MSSLDTPLARTSLRKEVYDRLRTALLAGELTSDDRLTETHISEMLGTSRAPVREALRQLEQEGLVEPLGTRGYRVVEAGDVAEISLLRIALEKLAVSLFIERADDDDAAALRAVVSRMRDAVDAGQESVAQQLDIEFHETLCRAARHDLLLTTWQSMRSQLALATTAINRSYSDARGLAERHEQVIRVLEQGDAALAEREIEEHIQHGLRSLRAAER